MTWQPIDTAPKDHSQKQRLLGWAWNTGMKIMRYSGWGQGTGGFETLEVADDGYAVWREFGASHWMPLPEPPKL